MASKVQKKGATVAPFSLEVQKRLALLAALLCCLLGCFLGHVVFPPFLWDRVDSSAPQPSRPFGSPDPLCGALASWQMRQRHASGISPF